MRDEISTLYAGRLPLLEMLKAELELEVKSALRDLAHVDRISFRVKDSKSFERKAVDRRVEPPYTNPLVEIEDQVAGRVIVFFINDMNIVIERLKSTFHSVERKHVKPSRDEEFGYESAHLICIVPPHLAPDGWESLVDHPNTFELQIRTLFMHAYAEPQHDIGYKAASDLPPDIRRELAWIAASAWGADHAYERVRRRREN